MRKIKTEKDIERIQRRNNIILGVVMIGLLVFSYAGFSMMSAEEGESSVVSELGFDFFRSNGLWKVVIGDEVFAFQNLPSEVEDVDVNLTLEIGDYSGKVLYFVNPGEGVGEVLNNIDRYVLRYQESCLEQDSGRSVVGGRWSDDLGNLTICEGDLPVKTCEDNLIVFKQGENMVYQNGSCVYLQGDIKAADAFLYEVLGIK
ncbi:hypothetical protein HNV12_03550 [Methanococcoides sp. SA1]|nr:hypothetical protein [Methanococcoides sp. SA1]